MHVENLDNKKAENNKATWTDEINGNSTGYNTQRGVIITKQMNVLYHVQQSPSSLSQACAILVCFFFRVSFDKRPVE